MQHPFEKLFEFSWHYNLNYLDENIDNVYNNWSPSDWQYEHREVITFDKFYVPCKEYFADSSVLDLGCGMGWSSFWSLHYGAKSVIGIDTNKKRIPIANWLSEKLHYNTKTNFYNLDICSDIDHLLNSTDTVFLSYVIQRHVPQVDLFERIHDSKVKKIILFDEYEKLDEQHPYIKYDMFDTSNNGEGYDPNVIRGIPNQKFYKTLLEDRLGWTCQRREIFDYLWFGVWERI